MEVVGDAVIDGEPVAPELASISPFDMGLLRGYGCFEAVRAYHGRPFRLEEHLRRLERSAAMLGIPLPDITAISSWVVGRAEQGGDCIVRIYVTGGSEAFAPGTQSRVVVFAEPIGPAAAVRIQPLPAPWHADGARSELTGAKTFSYAPNMAATLAARANGYDDALLVGRSGHVLEGPTYSVAWVNGGRIETPELDLGILESITRTVVLDLAADLGLPAVEGRFALDRLVAADEVFVMSTPKEVTAVTEVGSDRFAPGAVTARLHKLFGEVVAAELGL